MSSNSLFTRAVSNALRIAGIVPLSERLGDQAAALALLGLATERGSLKKWERQLLRGELMQRDTIPRRGFLEVLLGGVVLQSSLDVKRAWSFASAALRTGADYFDPSISQAVVAVGQEYKVADSDMRFLARGAAMVAQLRRDPRLFLGENSVPSVVEIRLLDRLLTEEDLMALGNAIINATDFGSIGAYARRYLSTQGVPTTAVLLREKGVFENTIPPILDHLGRLLDSGNPSDAWSVRDVFVGASGCGVISDQHGDRFVNEVFDDGRRGEWVREAHIEGWRQHFMLERKPVLETLDLRVAKLNPAWGSRRCAVESCETLWWTEQQAGRSGRNIRRRIAEFLDQHGALLREHVSEISSSDAQRWHKAAQRAAEGRR